MKRTPKGPKYRNARQGVRPAARLAATERAVEAVG